MNPTASANYLAIGPSATLVGISLVCLLLDLGTKTTRRGVQLVACLGLLAALVEVGYMLHNPQVRHFTSSYSAGRLSLIASMVVIATVFAIVALWKVAFARGEYLVLILFATAAMCGMTASRDLILFVVLLETMAICLYLLVAWDVDNPHRPIAAIKYFLFGIVSSALVLFGLSYLFGVAGDTSFGAVSHAIQEHKMSSLVVIGCLMTLVGLLFKVAAVPMHFWAPDAYQGAPISVATFLATASKFAGIVAIALCTTVVFPTEASLWSPLLVVVGVVSMLVGNFTALRQTNVLRLLAWSSIGHTGFLLVPLALATNNAAHLTFEKAIGTVVVYTAFYSLASVVCFWAVDQLRAPGSSTVSIADLQSSFSRKPIVASALSIALLSLAGIPPFGGWYAKFAIIQSAVNAGGPKGVICLGALVIATVVSLGVYGLVIAAMFKKPTTETRNGESERLVRPIALLMSGAIVVLGVLPGVVASVGRGTFFGA